MSILKIIDLLKSKASEVQESGSYYFFYISITSLDARYIKENTFKSNIAFIALISIDCNTKHFKN